MTDWMDRQLDAETVEEFAGLYCAVFNAPPFTRLMELKRLLESGQLDDRFRWTDFDLDRIESPVLAAAQ